MINCRRPSNRSSRLALPLGPSNSYFFSTASHGIRRRSAASASRAWVSSFSFTRSCWRAASHSCDGTTFGISMFFSFFDVIVCVLILPFVLFIVQRTKASVLDAYLPVEKRDARMRMHVMTGFIRAHRRRCATKSLTISLRSANHCPECAHSFVVLCEDPTQQGAEYEHADNNSGEP